MTRVAIALSSRDSTATHRLTTAQALVRFLISQHSERDGEEARLIQGIFGIFGHGNVLGIGEALEASAGELRYYQARNEQSMVHAAVGYARTMRRRATLACTSSIGPGATNMITGAATATINRLPVLLLPADYHVNARQGNVLQQLEHPISRDVSVNDAFRPVSRYFDRISRPEQLLASLPEAMRVLTDPVSCGAVTIALPQDVATEAFEFPEAFFRRRVWPIERQLPVESRIAEAAQLLARADRPLIVAGGGVHYSEAWGELRAISDQFGLPVAETFAGKGSVVEASELLLGGLGVEGTPAANAIASEADVVLCVGTRLADFTTASRSLFQHPAVTFINLNVDPRDAAKLGAMPLLSDAREGLSHLRAELARLGATPSPAHLENVARRRHDWSDRLRAEVFIQRADEQMSQGQLIGVLNDFAERGDVIVAASGAPAGDLLKIWDATGGADCQIEFGTSCMGHEIPAAIGARLARPGGEVYVYIGDGTYLLNPGELLTAVQEGLKITVVIAQNQGFQVIRRLQVAQTGRSFGNEFRARNSDGRRLEGPYVKFDLAANAASLGAQAWSVTSEADLKSALQAAKMEVGPCVIVVEVEKNRYLPPSDAWWDAPPPEVSTDATTRERRASYEEGRRYQRHYG